MQEAGNGDGDNTRITHQEAIDLFITQHASAKIIDQLITEFNSKAKYRKLITDHVLPGLQKLTTDALSEDSIAFLIADLNDPAPRFFEPILGYLANDEFVENRLLPLLSSTEDVEQVTLRTALAPAGNRLGKRYLPE